MANLRVDLEKSSHTVDKMGNGKCLPVFQEIGFHVIFDINMDDNFICKARLVARSHTTYPPESSTQSIDVSRESFHISFILAAKNDLDVYVTDICNIY